MDISGLRVGNGVDFHRFCEDEGDFNLPIGGVIIPFRKRVLAHSDGDVVLHSICDSIFGAISNSNIGTHFPPNDLRWKNASSELFLKYAFDMLSKRGILLNVDVTIICEKPHIMPFSEEIKKNIGRILNTEKDRIGIKAVTSEKMGFLGREEGIGAVSTCLICLF